MNKRLFLAINLPEEIKEVLFELVQKLEKNNKNKPVKWVGKENFHLTLHFFGDTPENKIDQITEIIESIINRYPVLHFKLTGNISAFPDLINPKVIYMEINELNDGQAINMQREIENALANAGFAIDHKLFKLHLTLGRVKFKTSISIPNFQFPVSDFQIQSVDLMESNLTPAGPIYSIVKSYNLKIIKL